MPAFSSAAGCGLLPTSVASLTKYCIPLNIINTQTTATANNLQIMVPFNALNYSAYLSGNLQNIYVYNSSSGEQIPTWIEGNVLNFQQSTSMNTINNTILWVNLGTNTIPASGYTTQYYLGLGSLQTNFFIAGNQIGENPLLSATYGTYDNGANVFNYYQEFGNLVSLPSGWSYLGGGGGNPIISFSTTNTELQTNTNSGYFYGIYQNSPATMNTFPSITDSYLVMDDSSGEGEGFGLSNTSMYIGSSYYIQNYGGSPTNTLYFVNNVNSYAMNYNSPASPEVYGLSIGSTTSASAQINYINYYTSSSLAAVDSPYYSIVLGRGSAGIASPMYIYWLLTRTYPPNGINPTVKSGNLNQPQTSILIMPAVSSYGATVKIEAICAFSSDSCAVDSPLGTHLSTGTGTAIYYATANILGYSSYYYANDITQNNFISGNFLTYVPVNLENISSSTGLALIKTLGITSSPYTWNSFYPIKIYTNSPSQSLNYSLIQYAFNNQIVEATNVLNLLYVPSSNSLSGNYIFTITERQNSNPQIITLTTSVNTLTMNNIIGTFTTGTSANTLCQYAIRYLPNCAVFPFGTNTFTVKPTSWAIQSDISSNTHANQTGLANQIDQYSNANLTFTPNVILTYGQFTPAITFPANLINNPGINSITQLPFSFIVSNAIPGNYIDRRILNSSIFDQQTYNPLQGNTTFTIIGLVNNYTVSGQVTGISNTVNAIFIPKSNFQNPIFSYTNLGTQTLSAEHFAANNNFCPANVNATSWRSVFSYPVGFVNGTSVTVNINTGYGATPVGDYLQVYEGTNNQFSKMVQQVLIATQSFTIPLQLQGVYAFKVVNPNCQLIHSTNYTTWASPINLQVPINSSVPTLTIPNLTAECTEVPINSIYSNVHCTGTDRNNLVNSWVVEIYNTSGFAGWTLINKTVIAASGFSYTSNAINSTVPLAAKVVAVVGTVYDPQYPFSFSFNQFGSNSLSISSDGLITLFFLLVGLGLGVGSGRATGTYQYAISTTAFIEAFMIAICYLIGLSTGFGLGLNVGAILFLIFIGVIRYGYESQGFYSSM